MTGLGKRIGEAGREFLLGLTVLTKAVAFPSDTRLWYTAQVVLVRVPALEAYVDLGYKGHGCNSEHLWA